MTTQIETKRLILRDVLIKDTPVYLAMGNDPRVYETLGYRLTDEETKDRVHKWVELNKQEPRKCYIWSILEKKSEEVIGFIRFWPEEDETRLMHEGVVGVGYGMQPDYWGQGYMTEALIAVTDFAHNELKIHRIEAGAIAENEASWRVMEKVGYVREGARAYRHFIQGKWCKLFYDYASVRPEILLDNLTV